MKKIFCILLLLALCATPTYAQEAAVPDSWNDIITSAPITADEFQTMTLQDQVNGFMEAAKKVLLAPLTLLAKISAVLILCAVAKSLTVDQPQGDLTQLLDSVVSLGAFSLCCIPMLRFAGVMQSALEQSTTYLACFVPVFSAAMVSCGQPSGALVFSGFFFGAVILLAGIITNVGLPLTRVLIAFHATSCVGSPLNLTGMASAVSKWCKWLLALCATVFATILSLQSIFAQNVDSAALKAGKFIVSSSVPVVGRAMSDALGSVLAGLHIVKGTLGFAAIAVIAAVFLPLLLECVAYHLVFTASGFVGTATGNEKISKMLAGFADCMSLYLSMSFFFCAVVICATMMMVVIGGVGG